MAWLRSTSIGVGAAALAGLVAFSSPANADWHRHWRHWHGWRPIYRPWAPPVYYAPPPVYYAPPPPVVYAPPPVYYPPAVSIGVRIP